MNINGIDVAQHLAQLGKTTGINNTSRTEEINFNYSKSPPTVAHAAPQAQPDVSTSTNIVDSRDDVLAQFDTNFDNAHNHIQSAEIAYAKEVAT